MVNNDYQKKLDEHRKSIDEPAELSRQSRHTKKTKKAKVKTARNWFLPTLFTIGIILPLLLLGYAYLFYNPTANESPENQQVVQLDIQPVTPTPSEEDTEEEENTVEEPTEPVEEEPVEEEPIEEEPVVEEETEEQVQEPVEPTQPTEPSEPENQRTHTVQPEETLYRIAINYYNDPAAVERIKAANNLQSDTIAAGQVLVLP